MVTRMELVLAAIVLALVSILMVCVPKMFGGDAEERIRHKSLEEHLVEVAGKDATNCGQVFGGVIPSEKADSMLACIDGAVDQKKGFRFTVVVPGIDSEIAEGFAGKSGLKFFFHYDSAPCGNPGCGEYFLKVMCDSFGIVSNHLACLGDRHKNKEI